jgi:DNA-binding NarL/FixJ family response regulator
MKVMLVSESMLLRQRLKALLETGTSLEIVAEVRSLGEAALLLEFTSPHVLIVDYFLQGKNGLEVLKTIRTLYSKLEIVILLHTVVQQYRKKLLEAGIDMIIDQAFEFESLPQVLQKNTIKIVASNSPTPSLSS